MPLPNLVQVLSCALQRQEPAHLPAALMCVSGVS
jgi:hypothetical protein